MDREQAKNWYRWLWFSPLITLPTLVWFYFEHLYIIRSFFCPNRDTCARFMRINAPYTALVLFSGLWHLILMIPALNREDKFVRWHGRQALFLAILRTAIPVVFVLITGNEESLLTSILFLLPLWLFGTIWGQNQAKRGECSLMSWFGHEVPLSPLEKTQDVIHDPLNLVDIIRFSNDNYERSAALHKLNQLGMIESLDGTSIQTIMTKVDEPLLIKSKRSKKSRQSTMIIIGIIVAIILGLNWGISEIQSQRYRATQQARHTQIALANIMATETAQEISNKIVSLNDWPLVLYERFDNNENGWPVGEFDEGFNLSDKQIKNGRYEWSVLANRKFDDYTCVNNMPYFSDFYLNVDVRKLFGPSTGDVGIIFRAHEEDYYRFSINDVRFTFELVDISRRSGSDTYRNRSGAIIPSEVNKLTVVVEGNDFTFLLNDVLTYQTTEYYHAIGTICLFVNLDSSEDEAKFIFDNLEIRAPSAMNISNIQNEALNRLSQASELSKRGRIDDALENFSTALTLDPDVVLSANDLNLICWYGSLDGFASEVKFACDEAVRLAPDAGYIIDSRGLNRAILGDIEGAISDFRYFVVWAKEHHGSESSIFVRTTWISELEAGRNPFTPGYLRSLKQ